MRPLPILTLLLLSAAAAQSAPLRVVATFSILGDFVRVVGGKRVNVSNLVPPNADVHTFQLSTGDIRALAGARVVFQNGSGFEPWFEQLRNTVDSKTRVVILTNGLSLRSASGGQGRADKDPHAWWNLDNTARYVDKIRDTLTSLDSAGRSVYASNAAAYVKRLRDLDAYAKRKVATLPAARRLLVTNHDALGYFADRYGFKLVGEVFPGRGTEQEPSARETARLIDAIGKTGVKAIFTENTVNPRLAQNIARETGAKIAPPLYTDALGSSGSSGDTFLKAFRFNVDTIVSALK
ncbi:metal ABC transporter solute-binding protein, Zn/Mn family [Deinococcus yavapaiensis]|uniref:Zinc/manganese transport system substrate-binding protein/manganese/iron transport system substrate-binding protein n=1 Tax=Deinococcus yavapaiensis KR-236 TaxID=694435 RepID=A0A318S4T1_9DEIO|nr:zinc ABC transporter substrate-binding protein [Deinococcus yavapaiensis]PYE53613.1 zinc/manganese transport system substrate-binding protein/manganese/iron transport system substrate-binding protein [Deinococcus yavapaiensis KR-236]